MADTTHRISLPPPAPGIRVFGGEAQRLFTFDLRAATFPAHVHISVLATNEHDALGAAYMLADEFAELANKKLEARRGL